MKNIIAKMLFGVTMGLILTVATTSAFAKLVPEKKFSISYGPYADQLGTVWERTETATQEGGDSEGVRGIQVMADGDLYACDVINNSIKHFSAKGRLISQTVGKLDNIQSFWVNPQGDIYVRTEEGNSEVSRYDNTGKRVWKKKFDEILPADIRVKLQNEFDVNPLAGFQTEMTDAPGGGVMILAGALKKGHLTDMQHFGIVIDSEGKLLNILPYFDFASDGLWWNMNIDKDKVAKGTAPAITINAYTANRNLMKTITLDVQRNNFEDYKSFDPDLSIVIKPDNKDGFFVIYGALLDKPIQLAEEGKIYYDITVNHYDNNGKYVEQFRFHGSPTGNDNVSVSPDGTLYFLSFNKTGVDVNAYIDQ